MSFLVVEQSTTEQPESELSTEGRNNMMIEKATAFPENGGFQSPKLYCVLPVTEETRLEVVTALPASP